MYNSEKDFKTWNQFTHEKNKLRSLNKTKTQGKWHSKKLWWKICNVLLWDSTSVCKDSYIYNTKIITLNK